MSRVNETSGRELAGIVQHQTLRHNELYSNKVFDKGCFDDHVSSYSDKKNILSNEKGIEGMLYGKEDFEKSIQYYLADGGVTRFNYVAPKTKYYSEDGGIQTFTKRKDDYLPLLKTAIKEFNKENETNT